VLVRAYLQTSVSPEFRARVFGVFSALYGPISIISLTTIPVLARLFGPAEILRGAALAEVTAAFVFFARSCGMARAELSNWSEPS